MGNYEAFQKSVASIRATPHRDDLDREMLAAADRIAELECTAHLNGWDMVDQLKEEVALLEENRGYWIESCQIAQQHRDGANAQVRELEEEVARLQALTDWANRAESAETLTPQTHPNNEWVTLQRQRIAELEAANARLRFALDNHQTVRNEKLTTLKQRAEAAEAKLKAVGELHIGAIPGTTDYANGWNKCRQHIHDELEALLKEQKDV